jgi:glyoxylase-like metal-dependent hydrolase (beta-lactamase superfamily II)
MSAAGAVFETIRIDAGNPSPITGTGNRTYLLVGTGGSAALIDAGVGEPDHLAAIGSHLSERRAQLDLVLVTHAHGDHARGAPAIAERFPTARFVKYPWPDEDHRYPVTWEPLSDGDTLVVAGQLVEVIHTPGHTPDHLAFSHRPSGTVWTGDLVTQGGSVMIHWSRGGDLSKYLRSLQRMMDLQPDHILPAHGPDVIDPAALLGQFVKHRLLRERQVLDALVRGPSTVQEIAESIYHGLAPALWPAALENVRAHLEKLRDEVQVVNRDGRWQRP